MALVFLKLRFFLRFAKRFLRKHVHKGVIIAKKSGTSSFDLVRIYQGKELVMMKGFVNSILNLQLSQYPYIH